MSLEQVAPIAAQITAVLVSITALGLAARKIRRWYKGAKSFFKRAEKVLELADYQFHNNGGESLLDLTQATARQSRANSQILTEVWTVVDKLEVAHTELAEKFETHLVLQADVALEGARAFQAAVNAQPPE